MSFSRRAFFHSVAGMAAAIPLFAADEKEPTFSTDVNVTSVLATVRDKQGRIVKDLRQEDFTLSEDGRPQTIRYFSRETDLPLTLGLLVDTSLSQRRVLGQEKTASFRFLDKVLRADRDQTFIMHFDHESELLQDLTSSRPLLQKALDELELPADQRSGGRGGGGQNRQGGGGGRSSGGISFPGGIGFPGGVGGGRRGGGQGQGRGQGQGGPQQGRGGRGGAGTTMYDAILLASDEITRKQKGRKALILLTDGVDQGSKTFLNDAIEAAQRADTLVYSILFADEQPGGLFGGGGGRGVDGRKVLQQISRETGGSFFEVSKKLSIDDIFDRLQEELRNQYSIGYTSDAKDAAGYKPIKLSARRADLVVQTREGYYSRR